MTTQNSQAVEAANIRVVEKTNCFVVHEGNEVAGSFTGPESKERAEMFAEALRAELTSPQVAGEVVSPAMIEAGASALVDSCIAKGHWARATEASKAVYREHARTVLLAASRSPAAGVAGGVGVPKGYALVPIEPTPKMRAAGAVSLAMWQGAAPAVAIWHEMLDASREQDSFNVVNAETKGVQDAATVAVGVTSLGLKPPKLNYTLLHAFASTHNVSYNDLCTVVRDAIIATPTAQGDGREAKPDSGSVHLGSGASCGVHGRAVVSAYAIQISDKPFAEEITVQRMRQIDGTPLWSVKLGGNCLNKSGEWEWEPMPSSRDDEFLARCRFESPEAAIDAAILSTASPAGEGEGKL